MDRVIDVTKYPLEQHRIEAESKRRMGIGFTGMANTIERMGYSYGSPEYLAAAEVLHRLLRDECYRASIELAKERGSFPAFEKDEYLRGNFINTLPEDIQDGIRRHGIRNSHLISYAPTGTISLTADNVSSGIEPVFSLSYNRTVLDADGVGREEAIEDYGYKFWGIRGKKASELTVDEHLDALAVAAKYCDSSVSKTINVGDNVSWEEFKDIYTKAWQKGCKGVTTFRASGKRYGILNEGAACTFDPETGERTCE